MARTIIVGTTSPRKKATRTSPLSHYEHSGRPIRSRILSGNWAARRVSQPFLRMQLQGIHSQKCNQLMVRETCRRWIRNGQSPRGVHRQYPSDGRRVWTGLPHLPQRLGLRRLGKQGHRTNLSVSSRSIAPFAVSTDHRSSISAQRRLCRQTLPRVSQTSVPHRSAHPPPRAMDTCRSR